MMDEWDKAFCSFPSLLKTVNDSRDKLLTVYKVLTIFFFIVSWSPITGLISGRIILGLGSAVGKELAYRRSKSKHT